MKLRSSPSILRIHSSKKKKGQEGLYAELLLFFPWRKEEKLRLNCIDSFNSNHDLIKRNKSAIYPNSNMIDIVSELIQNPEDARPLHSGDMDPTGEQENLDDHEALEPPDRTELPDDEPESKNVKSDGCIFKPIVVDEPDLMLKYARSFSFEQKIVFDKVVKFCKEVLRAEKGANIVPNPPQLIIKGMYDHFSNY